VTAGAGASGSLKRSTAPPTRRGRLKYASPQRVRNPPAQPAAPCDCWACCTAPTASAADVEGNFGLVKRAKIAFETAVTGREVLLVDANTCGGAVAQSNI
jgi:hypothetical protein